MAKRTHSFNVLLLPSEYAQLQQLAQARRLSMGCLFRLTLLSASHMILNEVPTCADGSRCMCPHLVPPTSASRQEHIPA